jgi:hypothetical protein
MASWPPPPLSAFFPLSYAAAAARRPGPSALARGPLPPPPDPASALAALTDLPLPTLDPAAADAILPSTRLGAGAGGVDAAIGGDVDCLDAGTDDLSAAGAGAGGLAAVGGLGALAAAPTGQGDLDAAAGGLDAGPDDLDAVDTGDLAVQGAAHALTAAYGLPLLLQLLL